MSSVADALLRTSSSSNSPPASSLYKSPLSEQVEDFEHVEVNCKETERFSEVVKPPTIKSLISMCTTITSQRADLVSVDRTINFLDKAVSKMMPGTILPEMKWMLLDTILCVADSPEKFPIKVRQAILESALGCEVFDAQRAMLQTRLFATWDGACWEVNDVREIDSINIKSAPDQQRVCRPDVYTTNRLQGEERTHTELAFPNFIVDEDKRRQRKVRGDRFCDKGFNRWWHYHDMLAHFAFLKSDQEMLL